MEELSTADALAPSRTDFVDLGFDDSINQLPTLPAPSSPSNPSSPACTPLLVTRKRRPGVDEIHSTRAHTRSGKVRQNEDGPSTEQ